MNDPRPGGCVSPIGGGGGLHQGGLRHSIILNDNESLFDIFRTYDYVEQCPLSARAVTMHELGPLCGCAQLIQTVGW
jgi:hypothetical protein